MAIMICRSLNRSRIVAIDNPEEYRHNTLLDHAPKKRRKNAGTAIPRSAITITTLGSPVAMLGIAEKNWIIGKITPKAIKTDHIA